MFYNRAFKAGLSSPLNNIDEVWSFVFYRFLLLREKTHEIEFLQTGGSSDLGFINVSTQTFFRLE